MINTPTTVNCLRRAAREQAVGGAGAGDGQLTAETKWNGAAGPRDRVPAHL